MPSLPDLLDEAIGRIDPTFDMDGIKAVAGHRRRARRWRNAATTITVAAVLCGALFVANTGRSDSSQVRTTPPSPPTSSPVTAVPAATLAQLRAALSAWSAFPVAAAPRPLVLLSDSGYGSSITFDNETKDAFESGAFNEPASFPDAPPTVDGYPIVNAADALATLRADASPVIGPHPEPTPLNITSIQLDRAPFQTDRGLVSLPAWTFRFRGVQGVAPVLAVGPSARFPQPPAALRSSVGSATLAPDGKTLTVNFTGAAPGTGPCTADYTIEQLATDTAVAVSVEEKKHGTGTDSCAALGYRRTASVTLQEPLGVRVLVDAATMGPIAVQP